MTSEQKLCAFYVVLWASVFIDTVVRGANSVFGHVFIWLASV